MKRTPLHDIHVKLGARMVPFGGWDMPVLYTSIMNEHKTVRTAAGLFDIGHMGIITISGDDSLDFLQRTLTNDISKLAVGSAQYSLILNTSAGVIDDIFVYRLADHYVIVLNASNTDKDIDWLKKNLSGKVKLTELKDKMTLLALQGPKSPELLQKICDIDLSTIGHHKVTEGHILKSKALIARTGYTGEDGFELFIEKGKAVEIWNKLLELGALPCGLGARDSLRLEAGMPLYGHEYNEGITPLETPFNFAVKTEKGDFIGKDALLHHKGAGISKKLVGITTKEAGIPRQGYKIFKDGNMIGYVTSGTMSPTLNKPVAMGYVRVESSDVGTPIDIEIRGKHVKGEVAKLPFYKR
jgi:aminomethyltransferase